MYTQKLRVKVLLWLKIETCIVVARLKQCMLQLAKTMPYFFNSDGNIYLSYFHFHYVWREHTCTCKEKTNITPCPPFKPFKIKVIPFNIKVLVWLKLASSQTNTLIMNIVKKVVLF